jgi:hypothetical protein
MARQTTFDTRGRNGLWLRSGVGKARRDVPSLDRAARSFDRKGWHQMPALRDDPHARHRAARNHEDVARLHELAALVWEHRGVMELASLEHRFARDELNAARDELNAARLERARARVMTYDDGGDAAA